MTMSKTQTAVINWLANGQTGLSSESMAFYLGFGVVRKGGSYYPRDPSDFNRCVLLLRMAPGLRKKLPEMAKLSKPWARMVAFWDEIESLLVQEVGSDWNANKSARAIETYALMDEVLAGKRKKQTK